MQNTMIHDRKQHYKRKYEATRWLSVSEEAKIRCKYGLGATQVYYFNFLHWLINVATKGSLQYNIDTDKNKRSMKGICPHCFEIVHYFGSKQEAIDEHKSYCNDDALKPIYRQYADLPVKGVPREEPKSVPFYLKKIERITRRKGIIQSIIDLHKQVSDNEHFLKKNNYII